MKTSVATLCLLFGAACDPSTTVGTFDVPTHIQNPTRLTVDSTGAIFDSMMNGQQCDWGLDTNCAMGCFPIYPMFPACDANGNVYQQTQQGLSLTLTYGQTHTIEDPACQGQTTMQLVALTVLNNEQKMNINMPQDCTDSRTSYVLDLYDRQWYTTMPAPFLPATPQDLPAGSP